MISLASIEETRTFTEHEIGCTVPLSSLTEANGAHPLLAQAASKIASSLIRKSATVGATFALTHGAFGTIKAKIGVVQLTGATRPIAEPALIARDSKSKHVVCSNLPRGPRSKSDGVGCFRRSRGP